MKAFIVIGANYGDEGKGLMTDYLAHKHKADYVVRFNGGAQAGHTVVTPEGKRHVFSHFGSGTLLDIPTILSRFFIVNPMTLAKELKHLADISVLPRICVDDDCRITTPFDMLANQIKERHRGAAAHGSCGVGINETIVRAQAIPFTFMDVKTGDLSKRLREIMFYYFFSLQNKGIVLTESEKEMFTTDVLYENYLKDCETLVGLNTFKSFSRGDEVLVFEGAQGLGLDEFMGAFPHVTRSNCGLRNVVDLQREWGFDIEEVVYVTRSYLTRHGNGPMESWDPDLSYEDTTNIPNQFQGTLRFGELKEDDVLQRVRNDLASVNFPVEPSLAVTHYDQKELIFGSWLSDSKYRSYGPTRDDVVEKK